MQTQSKAPEAHGIDLERARIKAREAREHIRKVTRVEELGTTNAQLGDEQWSVRIQEQGNEMYIISGRSSRMDLYLVGTHNGYLVAVPNMNRAGLVPADVNAHGIQEYVGLENVVDAATLAAAVRWLVKNSCEFSLGW